MEDDAKNLEHLGVAEFVRDQVAKELAAFSTLIHLLELQCRTALELAETLEGLAIGAPPAGESNKACSAAASSPVT
jgi:hypothetical protein